MEQSSPRCGRHASKQRIRRNDLAAWADCPAISPSWNAKDGFAKHGNPRYRAPRQAPATKNSPAKTAIGGGRLLVCRPSSTGAACLSSIRLRTALKSGFPIGQKSPSRNLIGSTCYAVPQIAIAAGNGTWGPQNDGSAAIRRRPPSSAAEAERAGESDPVEYGDHSSSEMLPAAT